MSLTPKQEKFAQCIADGMTQADSYRAAYNVAPTTKADTVINKAYKLMTRDDIRARVGELKDALTERNLWSRQDSVLKLIRAIDIAEEQGNSGGITGAVKALNDMHGFNAPIEQTINGNLNGLVQINLKAKR